MTSVAGPLFVVTGLIGLAILIGLYWIHRDNRSRSVEIGIGLFALLLIIGLFLLFLDK